METERYRTKGALDENAYRELSQISHFFVPRGQTQLYWAIAIVLGIAALSAVMARKCYYGGVSLLLAILFALSPGTRRAPYVIRRQLYPDSRGSTESFFTQEGLCVYSLTYHGQSVIRYRSIRRAAETEHYFILRIRGGGPWYTVVFKDCLTPEQEQSFLPFLLEKCPNLKVVR